MHQMCLHHIWCTVHLHVQVETENLNRGIDGVDARGVDAALKVLTVKDEELEKHPEK
jgi:hypothetical protein